MKLLFYTKNGSVECTPEQVVELMEAASEVVMDPTDRLGAILAALKIPKEKNIKEKNMMALIEIIQDEAFRAVGKTPTIDTAEYVLWEHTGYPSFWQINKENPTPEACLRAQVRKWALANVKDLDA